MACATGARVRRIAVVFNEGAGSSKPLSGSLERMLADAGVPATVHVLREGVDLPSLAAELASKSDVIVAAGGDGTVSAVAAAAIRARTVFGVIAAGTLNHFARDAGLPSDPAEAIAVLARGVVRNTDAAEVNGRIFVNNASLGVYPRLVWEREQEQRRGRGKWLAFAVGLARTWRRYRTLTVGLDVDGHPLVRRTPFVFIGNGEYKTEGLGMGGREHLGGGLLWAYVAPQCGRFEILALPVRALAGRLEDAVAFESFSASEVTIETARRHASVALDGELTLMRSPLHCRSLPGALRLIVNE